MKNLTSERSVLFKTKKVFLKIVWEKSFGFNQNFYSVIDRTAI